MAYILVVDDEEKMQHLLSIMLVRQGHSVDRAGEGLTALEMIKANPYDMVISDIRMPGMDGMELLSAIKELDIPCPVVFITAYATVDSAVESMRQGVVDYITKPFDEERILLTVERTLGISRLMAENVELKNELQEIAGGHEIIYQSEKMSRVIEHARRVAASDTAVLITGESGTGKEIVARFIHESSPRRKARFVPVNCAAISPQLVESELFGHEKGAFTGADRRTKGKFEYADAGTLFLDEIGDLPLPLQAKLLKYLDDSEVLRLGGVKARRIDCSVIAATNRNLENQVRKRRFRKDLYYRLNTFILKIPPLRQRPEDVFELVHILLGRYNRRYGVNKRILPEGLQALQEYGFPGNVRELKNLVKKAVVMNEENDIDGAVLQTLRVMPPSPGRKDDPPKSAYPGSLTKSLQHYEREILQQTRAQCRSTREMAAALGVSQPTVVRKMKKYGIAPPGDATMHQ